MHEHPDQRWTRDLPRGGGTDPPTPGPGVPGVIPETPHTTPVPWNPAQPIHEPVPFEIPGPLPQPIHEPVT
jgi:hypothetical protein